MILRWFFIRVIADRNGVCSALGPHDQRCWSASRPEFSFATCCQDFDVSKYEELIPFTGDERARMRSAAINAQDDPEWMVGILSGQIPSNHDLGALIDKHGEEKTPTDFYKAAAPLAAAVDRAAEEERPRAFAVFYSMTAPGNFVRRMSLRQTWLRDLSDSRYVFVLGLPDQETLTTIPDVWERLRQEQAEWGDLIMLNQVLDVYWGWEHTAKTLLAIVHVFLRVDASWYVNCHDDIYVNGGRLLELLRPITPHAAYVGNAYKGWDFVGFGGDDLLAYNKQVGHMKMPIVMKGGLWATTGDIAIYSGRMMYAGAAVPLSLWPSDDDTMGMLFSGLTIERLHLLRHGIEWHDWQLNDHCERSMVIAHDLKTPVQVWDFFIRHRAFGDPCQGRYGGHSRPESVPAAFEL